jgi:hypothetical protein
MRQTVKRVFNQEKRSGAQNKVPELCAADIRATQIVGEGAIMV